MKKRKMMWKVLREFGVLEILGTYITTFLLVALGVQLLEPSVGKYGDSLWYCYSVATTIGFGDFVATTAIGRLLTIILSLFSIFMVALIPTVLVNYFIEVNKMRQSESSLVIIDKLQNLENLSKEQLRELSEQVRRGLAKNPKKADKIEAKRKKKI